MFRHWFKRNKPMLPAYDYGPGTWKLIRELESRTVGLNQTSPRCEPPDWAPLPTAPVMTIQQRAQRLHENGGYYSVSTLSLGSVRMEIGFRLGSKQQAVDFMATLQYLMDVTLNSLSSQPTPEEILSRLGTLLIQAARPDGSGKEPTLSSAAPSTEGTTTTGSSQGETT